MLSVGDGAPEFNLKNTAGADVSLSETLETGPSVVLVNRGYWCSYCAEQLQTFSSLAYDLWRHYDTDVLPIIGDPLPELVEMQDRFELTVQLLSDPTLEVAGEYTGTEETESFGTVPVAGTFVVDPDGVVQYAHVAEHIADRTYANHVRVFIREGYEMPYTES